MDNKREHKRTPLKVQLRIDHPAHGQMLVTTRDISESGVFVVIDDAQKLLQIGELVSGQVQGLPIEAPVVLMRVVRFEASGTEELGVFRASSLDGADCFPLPKGSAQWADTADLEAGAVTGLDGKRLALLYLNLAA